MDIKEIYPWMITIMESEKKTKNLFNGSSIGLQVHHCNGLEDVHAPNRTAYNILQHAHNPSQTLCFCNVCIPSHHKLLSFFLNDIMSKEERTN